MRQLKIAAIAATLLLCCAWTGTAATPSDFYLDLLQKGITEYNAENYSRAASMLRVAAFGLLEATDRYQTAQVYRTVAADKANDAATVRDAARRVVAAERVQHTYASLTLPASVRTTFENVAKKILAPGEIAMLKNPPASNPAPQQTTTTTTPKPEQKPPATTTTQPQPRTAEVKPEPKPEQKVAETKPDPKPVETKTDPKPKNDPPPAKPQPRDLTQQFSAAERALAGGNLNDARRMYHQLLDGALTHEQAIRVAEGLYRARDFAYVLRAFERAGALKRGEEPYHFYLAVAYYETGKIGSAKKELAAALNYIEVTPDVARYRDKIESAVD